jgi:high affinity Mn2+ porin
LGGEQEKMESGPNQLAEYKDVSRLTFAVGKMAATDWFDQNKYSHDPRSQFLNWDLMYNGAWDYPADVRGYDFGAVVELNQKDWALRYGVFGEPEVANGAEIDPKIGVAHGQAIELEHRYKLFDRPGKIRWMGYWNRAHMGNYDEALALSPHDPDVTATRTYHSIKYGFCVNVEQEFTDNLGGFLRLGWNDGHTETWAFTETDRTVAFGFLLSGKSWHRDGDEIGTGLVVNGLSAPHRAYLAAGGLGFELGDGQLNYEPEFAWETYYKWQVFAKAVKKSIWISPDFQLVGNPGYNGDRGPVAIGTVRVHAEF